MRVHFENISEIISEELKNAETSVLVAVAWITNSYLIRQLENCLKRGVSVSVVMFDDKINNPQLFKDFVSLGGRLRLCNTMMHNKFCIIDNKTIINGSYNWTTNANKNQENIQITQSKKLVFQFVNNFEKIFNNSFDTISLFQNQYKKFQEFLYKEPKPKTYPCLFRYNSLIFILTNERDFNRIITEIYDIYIAKLDRKENYGYRQYLFCDLYSINYWNNEFHTRVVINPRSLPIGEINWMEIINDEKYHEKDRYLYDNNILIVDKDSKVCILELKDAEYYEGVPHRSRLNIAIHGSSNYDWEKESDFLIKQSKYGTVVTYKVLKVNGFINTKFEEYFRQIFVYNLNDLSFNKAITDKYNLEEKKKIHDETEKRYNEEYNRRMQLQKNKNECFIASWVYDDYQHYKVNQLRYFRDNYLTKTKSTRCFVKLYYKYSPYVVRNYQNNLKLKYIFKKLIDLILRIINRLFVIK